MKVSTFAMSSESCFGGTFCENKLNVKAYENYWNRQGASRLYAHQFDA